MPESSSIGVAFIAMSFCHPLSLQTSRSLRGLFVPFVVLSFAFALSACSQAPAKRSKEYFPSSVYGAASPRVVADGQPVPRGGGRYLVGKPYSVAGRTFVPKEVAPNASQTGRASWYGSAFHGRRTSNGEIYDMRSVSAAHPTWPLPSYVRVTNLENGRSMIVRLNDRGPFHANRVMDVSSRVAESLDFKRMGTASVKIDYVGKAGLAGSDDQILMASLRSDGRPANLNSYPTSPSTMVAEVEPPAQRESEPTGLAALFSPRPEAPAQLAAQPVRREAPSEPVAIDPPPGVEIVEILPPPRPSWLSQPVQVAQLRPEQRVLAPMTSVARSVPVPATVSSASFVPPLPPVRPLSLGAFAPTR